MNFLTLQGLTIPQGAVMKIADAQGNVLWSTVKIIGFTFTTISKTGTRYSTPFYAEDGMTWAEWCDSKYNTTGAEYTICIYNGNLCYFTGAYRVIKYDGNSVPSTDQIISSGEYTVNLNSTSGGGAN